MMKFAAASLLFTLSRAMELTSETWDNAVSGKTVFIKFLAPWWGHCKKLKPDWDKLIDDFKDSKTSLVADVDCTTGGKSLCEKHSIGGYPTIKWGDPQSLKDYEGGRDYNTLKAFADENLGPTCGPANLDLCSDEQKEMIAKFEKMDADELDTAIEEAEAKLKKIENDNQKKVDKLQGKIKNLQADIDGATKKKDQKVAKESKKIGLRFMKSVASANAKKGEL